MKTALLIVVGLWIVTSLGLTIVVLWGFVRAHRAPTPEQDDRDD